MNNRLKSILISALLATLPQVVKADYQLYGMAHLSSDVVRVGGESRFAMGSNGSRLGFKGSEELGASMQVVWKLESQFDFTGESATLSGRNRYLGVVSPFGTLVGGYQDSPFRTLGIKVDVMEDSLADRRSIIGAVRDQYDPVTSNRFNLRAKRSIMYVSPRIAGLQVRAMLALREFGNFSKDFTPERTEMLSSYSAVYKTRFFYLGAAYEEQDYLPDTFVARFSGGFNLTDIDLNIIYEMMESGKDTVMDREGYGVSLRYWFFDTALIAQGFYAGDDYWNLNSNGLMLAVGLLQRMSKNVEIYFISAGVKNDTVGAYSLGAADHGENFFPVSYGGDLLGVSLGMTYTF
ncbi:MAG: porin [Gammaproteobacteria bacterium]|nr:porin [Gammaproteobacteria bacterium]